MQDGDGIVTALGQHHGNFGIVPEVRRQPLRQATDHLVQPMKAPIGPQALAGLVGEDQVVRSFCHKITAVCHHAISGALIAPRRRSRLVPEAQLETRL